jgi:hypothetical protein
METKPLAINWAAEAPGNPSTTQDAICHSDASEFTQKASSVSRESPRSSVQIYTVLFSYYIIFR